MQSGVEKVAVIGLGIIGSRVADRLVEAGLQVTTWSRTPRGRNNEAVCGPDAVAGADVVLLFLKDGIAVREVMHDLEPALRAGQILINHSTVDLETTRWLAELCAEKRCGFLDAPFTGSKLAAMNGELVYYVSGDRALQLGMEPLLVQSSRKRLDCGKVGNATVLKLATNLMSACAVQSMAEALALVVQHGVAEEDLLEAVAVNANASPLSAMKLQSMMKRDFDTHFSLANMAKDARYALELANGMEMPAIRAVSQRMEDLVQRGLGELDYSALVKPYFSE